MDKSIDHCYGVVYSLHRRIFGLYIMQTEPLFTHAFQLHQSGRLSEAIVLYEQALQKAPNHFESLRALAIAYAQLGNMPEAIMYFDRALALNPLDASLHNNLGNAYKKSNDLPKAVNHYQTALRLSPKYAEAHANLAATFDALGEFKQALQHYREAVHLEPAFVTAHYHLGLLLLKKRELAAAQTQFNNVLILQPDHLNAQFYSGILQLEANHLDQAEASFEGVLSLNSEHVDSLTNLGVIALKREQGQIAIDYFTKALSLDNEKEEARNNLAATFIHHDRFENALMHYDVLLAQKPKHPEYLYNMGVAQMALGHLKEAIIHFETLIEEDSCHYAALSNLAAIRIRMGERPQAIDLLQRALEANPHDEASRFMLYALTGSEKQPETCPEYANHLFNNYALNYEQHMQGILHYSLPQHIGQLLHALQATPFSRTVDLGAGTGLTGIVLREMSKHLTGIDIAHKMLAEARKKHIYDELIESELILFLQQDKEKFDLAVAADVLPYLGNLEPLFKALSNRLAPEGLFVFSSEISEEEPWHLQDSARFCHHNDYIQSMCSAHGFQLERQEKVIARHQNDTPLPVMLYAARLKINPGS